MLLLLGISTCWSIIAKACQFSESFCFDDYSATTTKISSMTKPILVLVIWATVSYINIELALFVSSYEKLDFVCAWIYNGIWGLIPLFVKKNQKCCHFHPGGVVMTISTYPKKTQPSGNQKNQTSFADKCLQLLNGGVWRYSSSTISFKAKVILYLVEWGDGICG